MKKKNSENSKKKEGKKIECVTSIFISFHFNDVTIII